MQRQDIKDSALSLTTMIADACGMGGHEAEDLYQELLNHDVHQILSRLVGLVGFSEHAYLTSKQVRDDYPELKLKLDIAKSALLTLMMQQLLLTAHAHETDIAQLNAKLDSLLERAEIPEQRAPKRNKIRWGHKSAPAQFENDNNSGSNGKLRLSLFNRNDKQTNPPKTNSLRRTCFKRG